LLQKGSSLRPLDVDASSHGNSGFYAGNGHVLNLTTLRVGQDPVVLDEVDIYIAGSGLLVVPDRFAFGDQTLELEGSMEGAGDFFLQGTAVFVPRSNVVVGGSLQFGANTTVQGSALGHANQAVSPGCVQSGYGVGGAHGGNTQNFFGSGGTGTGTGCGDYLAPANQGSSGRNPQYSTNRGGAGGAAFRFTVAGAAVFDGTVQVNGAEPVVTSTSCSYPAGGGAGGSLWLDVGSLSGSGVFQSNGARGTSQSGCCGGAGSGGRIAVYASDVSGWSGTFEAYGWAFSSDSRCNGPAGTIYTSWDSTVLADNGNTGFLEPSMVTVLPSLDTTALIQSLRVQGRSTVALTTSTIDLSIELLRGDTTGTLILDTGNLTRLRDTQLAGLTPSLDLSSVELQVNAGTLLDITTDARRCAVQFVNNG
jgi:hypothetical protein